MTAHSVFGFAPETRQAAAVIFSSEFHTAHDCFQTCYLRQYQSMTEASELHGQFGPFEPFLGWI